MTGRAVIPNPDKLPAGCAPAIRARRYQAVLLPDEAIGTDLDQKFVWVLDAESRAGYRRITVGPLHEGLRIVREGIGPDDRVVVAGIQRVRPGMAVAAEDVAIESPSTPKTKAGG
jgi:multidrug efflux system membrane fusion protein